LGNTFFLLHFYIFIFREGASIEASQKILLLTTKHELLIEYLKLNSLATKINVFTKKITTVEEGIKKVMSFDLKRPEIYNNLISFYHKEINLFEEVIYLIQHLNDYIVLMFF